LTLDPSLGDMPNTDGLHRWRQRCQREPTESQNGTTALGQNPRRLSVAFLHSPASTRRAPSKHLAKFKAILAGRRQCQTLLSLAPTALPWQE